MVYRFDLYLSVPRLKDLPWHVHVVQANKQRRTIILPMVRELRKSVDLRLLLHLSYICGAVCVVSWWKPLELF